MFLGKTMKNISFLSETFQFLEVKKSIYLKWRVFVMDSVFLCISGVGINAGVMLMNLTRLRASKFSISVDQYYKRYASILFLADQDLLNVYFYFHSREL